MAMLAEPRRKQKWTLNPRGKQWSEDSNKFGQKMLEKMGWSTGKGLGASEQGITEHVRVPLKNDTSGIGFKKDALDEAWTEHQDSYNEFLKQLQENEDHNVVKIEENDVLSGKSLELKSKQSRARVHYQKFTRGKDVNKYSSKDLANIFGQKELSIIKKDRNKESVQEEKLDEIGMQDNRGGVITINGGNMAEYFMKKSQQFTSTIKKEQEEIESESELTKYVGFGFSSQVQRETKSVEQEEDAKGVGKKVETKKSQRHKEDSPSNYAFENPCIQLDSPEIVSNSSKCKSYKRKSLDDIKPSPSKKVKKFKSDESVSESEYGIVNAAMDLDVDNEPVNETFNGKEFEVPRVQFGLTNTGLDLSDETNVKKRRVTFNDHVEYSTDPINKKKKLITLDKFEVENTKRKKKKTKDKKKDHHVDNDNSISSGFVNEALELVEPTEVNDNEMVNKKKKKSKDKKKPKPDDDYTSSGFVNEALDLASLEKSVEVNDNEINEISEVRSDNVRKKRSRRSNLETIIEIPEEDGLDVTKRSKVEDDITEIDNSVVAVDSNQLHDDGAKKKNKKKKCKGNIEDEHKKVTTIEEKKIILESGNVRLEEEDEQSINEEKRIMDILQEKKMRKNKSSDQLEEEVQNDTEAVKLKKKKKKKENKDKSIDQNSEINPETDGNKENDVHEEFTETELKKKKKKKKKDKDENNLNVSKTNDLNKLEEGTEIKKGTPNKESRKENSSKETELTIEPKENSSEIQYSQDNNIDATQNTEFRNNKNRNRFSSSNRRSSTRNNFNNDNSSSPRNQRARMSKKLLVSLFNKSSVHNFPGSNMDEIKGYGVQ